MTLVIPHTGVLLMFRELTCSVGPLLRVDIKSRLTAVQNSSPVEPTGTAVIPDAGALLAVCELTRFGGACGERS